MESQLFVTNGARAFTIRVCFKGEGSDGVKEMGRGVSLEVPGHSDLVTKHGYRKMFRNRHYHMEP